MIGNDIRLAPSEVAFERRSLENEHEGERNNCFNKIQLAGQTNRDKITLAVIKS